MDLSLVIITLNEDKHLERCVRSVPFATELLVVDSGSSDTTVELARSLGARVMHHDFQDYASQKQWAIEQAGCDWVLSLDADEYLDAGLACSIRELLDGQPAHTGYRLPFRMLYMGRMMRFGPWSGETHLRLFRRGSASFSGVSVHEGIGLDEGSEGRLSGGFVIHESYEDLDEQMGKMRLYAGLWARREHAGGRRSGFFSITLRPLWRFLSAYVLRGGFLEGIPGLTSSAVSAFYVFLKWSMLREMTIRPDPRHRKKVR